MREQAASYQVCTVVAKPEAQIFIGSDKSFAYDFVYDRDSTQVEVYDSCVRELVEGVFDGYNGTILAYGQVRRSSRAFVSYSYVDYKRSLTEHHAASHANCRASIADG